jgi:hypothetical protein
MKKKSITLTGTLLYWSHMIYPKNKFGSQPPPAYSYHSDTALLGLMVLRRQLPPVVGYEYPSTSRGIDQKFKLNIRYPYRIRIRYRFNSIICVPWELGYPYTAIQP